METLTETLIFTACVRSIRREGNVLTRICPSVCPQRGEGYPSQGGTYPGQVQIRFTPRYLPPGQVRMGEGVPQCTYSRGQGLATWRAVCLLRSRRRTFLFLINAVDPGFPCHCAKFCMLIILDRSHLTTTMWSFMSSGIGAASISDKKAGCMVSNRVFPK